MSCEVLRVQGTLSCSLSHRADASPDMWYSPRCQAVDSQIVRQWIRKYAVFNLVCHISIFSFGAKVQKNPHNHGDYADKYLFVSIFTSPPRKRL